jgi:hypothetical protein
MGARHPPLSTPPAAIRNIDSSEGEGKTLKEEDKDKEDTEFDVGAFE